jgi:hypothetical protein
MTLNETIAQLEQRIEDLEEQIEELLDVDDDTPPVAPQIRTRCADCEVGTHTINEYYMVKDAVWRRAWVGRRQWWHDRLGLDMLCIGCLERRLGRTLAQRDFIDCPVNTDGEEFPNKSARLRDRMNASRSRKLKPPVHARNG